jgi:hypothetical protein
MHTIKITVGNSFAHNLTEEFITRVDLSDLDEVEMAAEECCGEYLDMHSDLWHTLDVDFEMIADECHYIIEEVPDNEHFS